MVWDWPDPVDLDLPRLNAIPIQDCGARLDCAYIFIRRGTYSFICRALCKLIFYIL